MITPELSERTQANETVRNRALYLLIKNPKKLELLASNFLGSVHLARGIWGIPIWGQFRLGAK